MSFDAIEKYNTRLLIPKETGMFATVAVVSNGRQKDDTKEHVHSESPLTNCFSLRGRRSKFLNPFTYKSENICI